VLEVWVEDVAADGDRKCSGAGADCSNADAQIDDGDDGRFCVERAARQTHARVEIHGGDGVGLMCSS
jgi:hypothetical protein